MPDQSSGTGLLKDGTHIGLIVPGFSPGDQGIPILNDMVGQLTSRLPITAFALRFPGQRSIFNALDAEVHALGGGRSRGITRPVYLASWAVTIARAVHHKKIRLLHGFWADEPGFLATLIGRMLGIPAIVSVMGGELVGLRDIVYGGLLSRINPLLTHFALHYADAVTSGSKTMIELCQSAHPSVAPIHLPLGVRPELFSRDSASAPHLAGGFKLLSVASLVPVKDHATLLRALAQVVLVRPDTVLHLLGDGVCRLEIEALASRLGLAGHVVLHGAVPRAHLAGYYRQADAFVLSSRFESQAIVLLEAGASGLPVVGTAVGSIPELKPSVIEVPTGDAQALAAALLRLADDPALRKRLGNGLREKVTASYTLDHTIQELLSLYQDLLSHHRQP